MTFILISVVLGSNVASFFTFYEEVETLGVNIQWKFYSSLVLFIIYSLMSLALVICLATILTARNRRVIKKIKSMAKIKISKHKLNRIVYKIIMLGLFCLLLFACANLRDSFFRFYNHIDTLGQEDKLIFYIYLVALCIHFFILLVILFVIIIFIIRKPMIIRMINQAREHTIESVYELYFLEKEDSTEK